MTDEELEHMKRTVHELCGVVLRLQIDLNGKPDLHDQFAIAALTGMFSNPVTQEITEKTIKTIWSVADLMMEARK
jgi:hypothetical protein